MKKQGNKTKFLIAAPLLALLLLVVIAPNLRLISFDFSQSEPVIWVTEPHFEYADNYNEGIAAVAEKDVEYRFLNGKGPTPSYIPYSNPIGPLRFAPSYANGILRAYTPQDQMWMYDNTGSTIYKPAATSGNIQSSPSGNISLNEWASSGCQPTNHQGFWVDSPTFIDCKWISKTKFWGNANNANYIMSHNIIVEIPDEWRTKDDLSSFAKVGVADDEIFPMRKSISMGNYTWFYIDISGKIVIPGPFEDADYFGEGLAAVCVDGKYGYINKQGEFVIEPQFSSAGIFHDGYAIVSNKKGKTYIIDTQGNIKKSSKVEYSEPFRGELAACGKNFKDGLLNTNGKWVLWPRYLVIKDYGEKDWLLESADREYGLYLAEPGVKIPAKYDRIEPITPELTLLLDKYKCGILNTKTGKWVMPMSIGTFGEVGGGLIAAYHPLKMKWGYMDYSGKWIIEPQFEEALGFYEGVAAVRQDGKYGYIANPMLPYAWDENEQKRAESLGLVVEGGEAAAPVTAEQAYQLAEKYYTLLSGQPGGELAAYLQEENQFKAQEPLRKEMAAKISSDIDRFQGKWVDLYCCFYEDVNEENPYYSTIAYANSKGFLLGEGEHFNPQQQMTLGDLQALLLRQYEYWWQRSTAND